MVFGIGLAFVIGTMARTDNHSDNHTSAWAAFLIVAVAAGAGFLVATASPDRPKSKPDDWRRTAAGWERAATWQKTSLVGAASDRAVDRPSRGRIAESRRLDTHPAALAFLQLVGALTVLSVFTAPAPQSLRGWRAVLTQSFRSSAFGS